MSLGIAFKGPEGIVLAADSRVTLTVQHQGGPTLIPVTYDNATKLLKVANQDYVGVVTYGLGVIGETEPRTAHSFLPEFETSISESPRLGVEKFAQKLSDFFMDQFKAKMPSNYSGPPMIFLVGGYNEGEPYGRVYQIQIPDSLSPVEKISNDFGPIWGGQLEMTSRIIHGYDIRLLKLIKDFLNLSDAKINDLQKHLAGELAIKIPYQFLPLQDCVDLAIFMIRTTVAVQSWQMEIRGVGGAIDVATITRPEGFKYVQRKEIVGERSVA